MKTQVDAVTVEIVGNLLLSIAEEMGVALIKSAYSTNIKERRDISTAVFYGMSDFGGIGMDAYVPLD